MTPSEPAPVDSPGLAGPPPRKGTGVWLPGQPDSYTGLLDHSIPSSPPLDSELDVQWHAYVRGGPARWKAFGRCAFCYSRLDADGACRVTGCRMVGSGFERRVWPEEPCDVCKIPTTHHRYVGDPVWLGKLQAGEQMPTSCFSLMAIARCPECHERRFHAEAD